MASKEYHRKHYLENKDKYLKRAKAHNKIARKRNFEFILRRICHKFLIKLFSIDKYPLFMKDSCILNVFKPNYILIGEIVGKQHVKRCEGKHFFSLI